MPEEFFDLIIDIFKKGIKERGFKEGPSVNNTSEFKGITVDMPKQADAYHGSSYEILCNKLQNWCKIKGDLVIDPETEMSTIRLLGDSHCEIFETHRHLRRKEERLIREETHLHFICEDKDRYDTIDLMEFLKDYRKL